MTTAQELKAIEGEVLRLRPGDVEGAMDIIRRYGTKIPGELGRVLFRTMVTDEDARRVDDALRAIHASPAG